MNRSLWPLFIVSGLAGMQWAILILRISGAIPTEDFTMPIFHVVFCTALAVFVWRMAAKGGRR